jgi:hypothetical protein
MMQLSRFFVQGLRFPCSGFRPCAAVFKMHRLTGKKRYLLPLSVFVKLTCSGISCKRFLGTVKDDLNTVPIAQTGLFTSAGSGKSEVEVDGSAVLAETNPLKQLFKFYQSIGFCQREAIEKAEAELKRRADELKER